MTNEPTNWKYINSENNIVARIYPDGREESCFVTVKEVQEWIAQGNTPEAANA